MVNNKEYLSTLKLIFQLAAPIQVDGRDALGDALLHGLAGAHPEVEHSR